MDKVNVRVIGRPILRTPVGGIVAVSLRDARILTKLGRVEPVADDRPAGGLRTPEAGLRTVAHTGPAEPVVFVPSVALEQLANDGQAAISKKRGRPRSAG